VSPPSNRKERFVVALRPEGGKLVGTGKSEPDQTPVAAGCGAGSRLNKETGDGF
jgi:hypothetical protein